MKRDMASTAKAVLGIAVAILITTTAYAQISEIPPTKPAIPGQIFAGSEQPRPGLSVDFNLGPLRVSADRRHLEHSNGKVFPYLADTGWYLFARTTEAEAIDYLENRREKGFTVIQAMVVVENRGLTNPNRYGHLPFINQDPAQPNEAYFAYVDRVVQIAESKGLIMALVPVWGDKVNAAWDTDGEPQIFRASVNGLSVSDSLTRAYNYGRYIGTRYGNRRNVMLVNGGDRGIDRTIEQHVWNQLGQGLRDGSARQRLITFHPTGNGADNLSLREQWYINASWLDFVGFQSGHHARDIANYDDITALLGWNRPVIDLEPRYEGHAVNWNVANGYFDSYDVRQAFYWSILAGGAGVTYGNHAVWSFNRQDDPLPIHAPEVPNWYDAVNMAGAYDMVHLRRMLDARTFESVSPDQSLIASDQSSGVNRLQAARGDGFAWVYYSNGRTARIRMGKISGNQVDVWWMNPRTGDVIFVNTFSNNGELDFTPPSSSTARGNDWILWVDDASRRFARPML